MPRRRDRVLFPATGYSKSDAIDYYSQIAKALLPHLRNRPLSFKRYPNTIDDQSFWEKDAPAFTPSWVKTFPVPRRSGESDINYIVINDRRTLLWVVDYGMIEIHPFLHRAPKIERPTEVVFDLDPGPRATILDCARVAFLLRDVLNGVKLESLVKVSGSKGLQLYVPLNSGGASHAMTEAFAQTIAAQMERAHPALVVAKMARNLRAKRVFIDWSQNADFKTTVSVYSLRTQRERPYVSMPVSWRELESATSKDDIESLEFSPERAVKRVAKEGDLFAPLLEIKQTLPRTFVEAFSTMARPGRASRKEPKSRTQSGRRIFVVPRTETGDELWLDFDGMFKRWILRPDREGERKLIALPAGEFPVAESYSRGEVQEEYRGRVTIEDLGRFEWIEGSLDDETMTLFFSGKILQGEWTLEKIVKKSRHKSWLLTPVR